MGASAGAINMSAKWLCSKNTGYKVETSVIYEGIGLDDFYFYSTHNLEIDNTSLQEELFPLLKILIFMWQLTRVLCV